jgi:phenylacetate-CoA ligase
LVKVKKLSDIIYNISPVSLQNVGISFYGLKIYLREYGGKFNRILKEFEDHERWSIEQLREYQNEKLRNLIEHCYHNVDYYREIMDSQGLKPSDINSVDDLREFPVLTRDDLRNNSDRLISKTHKKSRLILGHTSGTTGSPLEFYYDKNICLLKNVVDWRQKIWGGVKPRDRMAFFHGRVVVPIEQNRPPFWRMNYVMNHLFFSSFHMSKKNIDRYADKLKSFRPAAVEGYPSTLSIIANYLLKKAVRIDLKAAFTSSETLLPEQREAIEKAFNCRLYDFYGLAERVMFATECEYNSGHHINMDFGITEVLGKDDKPAKNGELGRIVATGLHNYAMPLIRYKTSDITSISDEKCACGRTFPTMKAVATKDEDIITTPDGRLISSSILTHPFKPMHNIAESQLIQEDRNNLTIKIVKREGYTDSDTVHLTDELKVRLGNEIGIKIEFVDSIPRTKSGKFRWIISKVPLEF